MKKQKKETIKTEQMSDMVHNHKMKSVSPPQEAGRGPDGRYALSRAEAAQYWFKAAKEQHPDNGFLGVAVKDVDKHEALDREQLYKGKKKEIVKE